MPRKSRKKGGNPLRLTLCQDFKRTGQAPYSAATEVCCNKDKNCKKKNKKTSKVRMRSASQREVQRKKIEKYSKDRKMNPGEKLGDYGSHCVDAAGRRWGHTKPRWNREGDPEEGIAVQNLRNWHPSPESLMQPPPEFNPGKKMAGNPLVCREDGWTGAEGGYRGEWCLLDPVAGFGSLMKNNLASSDKQLCRTRYAKNWLSDNKLTLVAAKKAGYFFDDNEKHQAIEDARKKRIMTEGVKLRAELQAEEKRRKAAVNRENERKQKLVSAGVQAQAHDFAEKNTFFDAKENDDDEFFDAQSGGRVAWLPVEQGENNIVDFLKMYINKNIKFMLTEGNSWDTAMGDGGGGEGKLNKVLTFRRQGDDERAPAPHVGFSIINDDGGELSEQWFSTGRDQHFEFFQVYKPMKSARKTGVAHRVKAQRGVAHGGRRRTRRRRKNRRKRGGRRKSRRVRRRKTRRKTRRKRGGTSCPSEKEPWKMHLIDCPVRGYQACCETEAKEGKEKCQIVAGGKDEEGARAICVSTNVIDLS